MCSERYQASYGCTSGCCAAKDGSGLRDSQSGAAKAKSGVFVSRMLLVGSSGKLSTCAKGSGEWIRCLWELVSFGASFRVGRSAVSMAFSTDALPIWFRNLLDPEAVTFSLGIRRVAAWESDRNRAADRAFRRQCEREGKNPRIISSLTSQLYRRAERQGYGINSPEVYRILWSQLDDISRRELLREHEILGERQPEPYLQGLLLMLYSWQDEPDTSRRKRSFHKAISLQQQCLRERGLSQRQVDQLVNGVVSRCPIVPLPTRGSDSWQHVTDLIWIDNGNWPTSWHLRTTIDSPKTYCHGYVHESGRTMWRKSGTTQQKTACHSTNLEECPVKHSKDRRAITSSSWAADLTMPVATQAMRLRVRMPPSAFCSDDSGQKAEGSSSPVSGHRSCFGSGSHNDLENCDRQLVWFWTRRAGTSCILSMSTGGDLIPFTLCKLPALRLLLTFTFLHVLSAALPVPGHRATSPKGNRRLHPLLVYN